MSISTDARDLPDKDQHTKTLSKLEKGENFLKLKEDIYEKPRGNIIFHVAWLNTCPKTGKRPNGLLSPLMFNIILKILATAIKQGK